MTQNPDSPNSPSTTAPTPSEQAPAQPPAPVPTPAPLEPRGLALRSLAYGAAQGLRAFLESKTLRRSLVLAGLGGLVYGAAQFHPVVGIEPGEVAVRVNRLTGSAAEIKEGWALSLPGVHRLRRYSMRDVVYRPARGARADGEAPYQSAEGLSVGVDVAVRYALDPARVSGAAQTLPDDVGKELVEPLVDGVLHRVLAQHTVREIFGAQREEIQTTVEKELRPRLAQDGVVLRSIAIGNVDLPQEYRSGLEKLLSEELQAEQMRYTLELKEKGIKQTELESEADRVRRTKAAEAAAEEEVIAAKAKAEAMQHILPFKEKEIEQKRLEAEAAKVTRLKQAEAESEARQIEAQGEAESRRKLAEADADAARLKATGQADGNRKLAEADAYRMDLTGKASTDQMAREGAIVSAHPLLIQKALAEKLGDKLSVIIAPPQAGGLVTASLLGQLPAGRPSSGEAAREPSPESEAKLTQVADAATKAAEAASKAADAAQAVADRAQTEGRE